MKSIKLLLTTIAISLMLITTAIFFVSNAHAVQYKFVAMDNSKETKICVFAGNNEKKALIKIMARDRFSRKHLTNSIRCNDMFIANFAHKYSANLTFDYLKKYTRKKNLDKIPNVTIKDILARKTDNKSTEKIILVYVGH